jgi:hypothetical protein
MKGLQTIDQVHTQDATVSLHHFTLIRVQDLLQQVL